MRFQSFNTAAIAILPPVLFAAAAMGLSASTVVAEEYPYGTVAEVTPEIRLIAGRELDMAAGEVDVANVILYKSGSTLVVIDTGGTAEFVEYLDKAAKQLEPYDEVVLVTTHGHADHVGNNAWIDTLGVPARHYISARDLTLMREQVPWFAERFDAANPYLPDSPPGEKFAQEIVDLFGGLDTESKSLTVLESLPLEEIMIGDTVWNGWSLLDGEVLVLLTEGHTAGHVAVFLPKPKLLHLADETTGYYQAFSGGSAATNLLTLQRSAEAVEAGAIESVTDGHTFEVHRGQEAADYLNGLVRGAFDYNAAVARVLAENPDGITIPDLVATVAKSPEMADAPGGANPIPIFSVMQMLNKLEELGVALPDGPDGLVKFPG